MDSILRENYLFDMEKEKMNLLVQPESLRRQVADTDREFLHFTPDESIWSLHLILGHIFKVEKGVKSILMNNGGVEIETEALYSEEQIHLISMDRRVKYKAPIATIPTRTDHSLDESLKAIKDLRSEIYHAIEMNQIVWNTSGPPHPLFGKMSKMDWLHFLISHFDRHMLQIEELKKYYSHGEI